MRILKYFLITEPTVTIEANDGRIHAHQGSDVEFRCLIRGMLQKPAYVFWYVDVSYGKVVFGFTHPSFISVPTFPYFPHSESFSTIEIDIFSRKNVHFHTFSTPLFTKGGSKLSSNVTIHFLVLTYFATIYLILTPIQLPSTFKKMSDKGYWKRFCEYLRIRKRKTSLHILCMCTYSESYVYR